MREGSHGPRPGHPSTLMLHVCGWLAHMLMDGAFPGVSHALGSYAVWDSATRVASVPAGSDPRVHHLRRARVGL